MKIKTYPLQFTEEYLKEIKEKAKENNMSIKEFILNAIQEKLLRKLIKISEEYLGKEETDKIIEETLKEFIKEIKEKE